jgi:hypothetical protein
MLKSPKQLPTGTGVSPSGISSNSQAYETTRQAPPIPNWMTPTWISSIQKWKSFQRPSSSPVNQQRSCLLAHSRPPILCPGCPAMKALSRKSIGMHRRKTIMKVCWLYKLVGYDDIADWACQIPPQRRQSLSSAQIYLQMCSERRRLIRLMLRKEVLLS